MHCTSCNNTYPLEKGMPHLYIDDEKWRPKAQEATGWVTHTKNLNLYNPELDGIDYLAPDYPAEPWIRIKQSFEAALKLLQLTGKETILDLGAGKGWASKQLALLGCNVVALDITPDEMVGLGRAKALMTKAETYFERLLGDGENLPFFANSFDIVFCCGSIHHSSNLPLLMANIHRILKPNGRLCAINEPCIDILTDEKAILAEVAADELALDINENRPNLIKYINALWQNNFNILTAFPAQSIPIPREQIPNWALSLNATFRRLPFRTMLSFLNETKSFLLREIKAFQLNGRPYLKVRLNPPREKTARSLWSVLLWCNTELIFLAQKTET